MTHLLLGLSAWNSLFSRFLYLCTCCSSCFHCLRLRISGQQAVAFHKSEDGFGILVAAVLVQPELHSAIAVGILTPFLLTCNLIYDCLIRIWLVQSLNIRIIPASGNAKKSAHSVNGMVLPVTVYYSIFYPVAHSLSMDCRKSRSNSFSIFKRSFSAL